MPFPLTSQLRDQDKGVTWLSSQESAENSGEWLDNRHLLQQKLTHSWIPRNSKEDLPSFCMRPHGLLLDHFVRLHAVSMHPSCTEAVVSLQCAHSVLVSHEVTVDRRL